MSHMKQTFHYQIEIEENLISFEFYITKPNHTADEPDCHLPEERRFSFKLSYDWSQLDLTDEVFDMINHQEWIDAVNMHHHRNEVRSIQLHTSKN